MSRLRVTYVKSAIGYRARQKETIRSLGLRRLHHTVVVADTPVNRGMVDAVRHLVSVETVEEQAE
ncbi:MAG: 50S ribosomal protein L30 [Chloroflexi bacterium]|nr:50S ribosomal protein L30 [Chloroflexota bacterium]